MLFCGLMTKLRMQLCHKSINIDRRGFSVRPGAHWAQTVLRIPRFFLVVRKTTEFRNFGEGRIFYPCPLLCRRGQNQNLKFLSRSPSSGYLKDASWYKKLNCANNFWIWKFWGPFLGQKRPKIRWFFFQEVPELRRYFAFQFFVLVRKTIEFPRFLSKFRYVSPPLNEGGGAKSKFKFFVEDPLEWVLKRRVLARTIQLC